MRSREETLRAKREWMKAWRKHNPDDAKLADRKYRMKRKEEHGLEVRTYHRDYMQVRRHSTKHEDDLATRREHYKKNRDKVTERIREYNKQPHVMAQRKAYLLKWRAANPDKIAASVERNRATMRERHKLHMRKIRASVIQAYGGKCTCCGETEPVFLALDHINNDGKQHRKEVGGNGVYMWAIRNNYPKDRLQVLCNNCNLAKERVGICPHQSKKACAA